VGGLVEERRGRKAKCCDLEAGLSNLYRGVNFFARVKKKLLSGRVLLLIL